MAGSFDNPKELKFVITLGTGNFGSSNNNQITLQGYRASVDIDKAGGMMMGTLRAQIWGVAQSDMNAVTTLQWKPKAFIPNTVQVFAIDGQQQTLVFTGNIVNAWGNYRAMPDVFLEIQAQAAYAELINGAAPNSYPGSSFSVPTVMQQLASAMGLTFENNGVVATLPANQYLPNTLLEQAQTLARAAGVWMYIDNGVLAITPPYQPRSKPVPLISAETGMVGYPTFDGVGLNFQTLFNPSIIFGGSVNVSSQIPLAAITGVTNWIVTSQALKLDSVKPNGAWFSTVRCTKTGLAVVSQ